MKLKFELDSLDTYYIFFVIKFFQGFPISRSQKKKLQRSALKTLVTIKMEMQKKEIPDKLWVGFGRKDAPIIREPQRFKDYFYSWMLPHKYKIKDMEFWPGWSWGTVQMESREARDAMLEHVLRKPFRPDNESGWVLNKFEKVVPINNSVTEESPVKKSPKKSVKDILTKKRVVDSLKEQSLKTTKGRKSRSNTASPATTKDHQASVSNINNGLAAILTQHEGILDLSDEHLPPLEPIEVHRSAVAKVSRRTFL